AGVCAILALRAPRITGACLTALALLAGSRARGGAHAAQLQAARATIVDGGVVRVWAVVDEPTRLESGDPVAITRVLGASVPISRGARVRLRLPAGCGAEWGDTLLALVRLELPSRVRVPGGFDARASADAAGVCAYGRAYTAQVHVSRAWSTAPVRLATRARRAVERALASTLSPGARELAAPLLFGDRSAMTPELDAQLRGAGLVHLLALSGLHVVWLAAVARGCAGACGAGTAARAATGAACALAYAWLAGPLPSLLRAVVGECASALARANNRALDPMQSLGLAACALLVWRPAWANDLGFQLSCAATFGLVALSRPIASPIERWPRLHALAQPLAATAAAQITALPLVLERFHALPWTGMIANLAAVPLAELLLAAAGLGGICEAVLPGAGAPWLPACEPLARGLREVASRAAAAPLALLPAGDDAWSVGAAWAGAALLAAGAIEPRALAERQRAPGRARVAAIALGATLLACALLGVITQPALRPRAGTWWLVGIDVGQGDALALGFGDDWWLVDAGGRSQHWDAGEGAVLPFLRWAGVRELAVLALTHDDGDHTGGAPAVRRSLGVRRVVASAPRPGVPGPGQRFQAHSLARGDTLRLAPMVRVLWPPGVGETGDAISRRGDNASSLVLEVGDGAGRALLTADADSVVEGAIEPTPNPAVLKAGHHGSASSSGVTFARALAPRVALLSCGRHNAYGHPSPLALARLLAAGARLDRTDLRGTLWYEGSQSGMRDLAWRARYRWRKTGSRESAAARPPCPQR
ncbi:MAG: ComEC/Rec2 family competence protein, partial [Candidatus Eisenbacteria bacterium]